MPLELGDHGQEGRKLGGRVEGRLRVGGRGLLWPRRGAALAVAGGQGDDVSDAVGAQPVAVASGVSRVAAALPADRPKRLLTSRQRPKSKARSTRSARCRTATS